MECCLCLCMSKMITLFDVSGPEYDSTSHNHFTRSYIFLYSYYTLIKLTHISYCIVTTIHQYAVILVKLSRAPTVLVIKTIS